MVMKEETFVLFLYPYDPEGSINTSVQRGIMVHGRRRVVDLIEQNLPCTITRSEANRPRIAAFLEHGTLDLTVVVPYPNVHGWPPRRSLSAPTRRVSAGLAFVMPIEVDRGL